MKITRKIGEFIHQAAVDQLEFEDMLRQVVQMLGLTPEETQRELEEFFEFVNGIADRIVLTGIEPEGFVRTHPDRIGFRDILRYAVSQLDEE